jgi:hypothetical protein
MHAQGTYVARGRFAFRTSTERGVYFGYRKAGMYICVYVYVCVCMYVYKYVCMCMYVYNVQVCIHVCMYMYVCMYIM